MSESKPRKIDNRSYLLKHPLGQRPRKITNSKPKDVEVFNQPTIDMFIILKGAE